MPREPIAVVRFAVVAGSLLFSGVARGQAFKPECSNPAFPGPPPASATGVDSQCPVQGAGGPETDQNKAKNSFCAVGPAQPITIDDMITLQQKVENNKAINFGNTRDHPLSSAAGPAKDRGSLKTLGEGALRELEGFVFAARQEGKESVNCGAKVPNTPLFHDIHISLVADETSTHGDECLSIVAEMIPHHRPDSWTAKNVQRLAAKHRRVRVTGQLFFDSSHSPCQEEKEVPGDPKRSSLWEIHPIYKFDVCTADPCNIATNWVSLDQWLSQNP